jgi:predicted ATPase
MEPRVFVGRQVEIGRLDKHLHQMLNGEGQVCFIAGEAGTGKTALVEAFIHRAQANHKELILAAGSCNAHTGMGDPFLPFREVIGTLTGSSDVAAKKRATSNENDNRIKGFIGTSAHILIDFAPDLIETFVPGVALIAKLGKSVAEIAGLTDRLELISKRKQIEGDAGTNTVHQNQIFEQYTNYLSAYAETQPVILVLDDLHWADAPSINLLFHLSRRIQKKKIMIIGTYRQVEISVGRHHEPHPLEAVITELKRYHGDLAINLSDVGESSKQMLVNQLVDIEPNRLGEKFRSTLHRQTDGNPLFVVELLEDMKESGALVKDSAGCWVESPALAWGQLPARVEGVIERRIKRLDSQLRSLLNVGCVEGEEFTAEVVARAQTSDARGVVRLLSGDLDRQHRLVNARGVQRLGLQRLSMYQFQHNLFQKYLYNSMDGVERSYLHEDVGLILEELYGDQADKIALNLARHFKEAGIYAKAVHYLYLAGTRALNISAHLEAVTHFSEGLTLLETFPQGTVRDQQELLLQTMLGQALIATEGYAAPKVEAAFNRARELCNRFGETPQLFPVLWGLWAFYEVRGQYTDALKLGEDLYQMAESQQDETMSILAHFALGNTHFLLGHLEKSVDHFSRVEETYEPAAHGSLATRYGQDPAVTALSWKSIAEWLLGYPDRALETIQAALTLARQIEHPFSLAYALYCATWLHQLRREAEPLEAYAQELIPLAQAHGFPFWLAVGLIQQAWAIAERGQYSEAITQLDHAITLWRSIGAGIGEPYYLSILAEIHGANGQSGKGLALLDEARSIMERSGERWEKSLLCLVEGEIYRRQSPADMARVETSYQEALRLAQEQGSNTLALQAAQRLSILWEEQGKAEQASEMLAEIYNCFNEGFDTPERKEARGALEQRV